MNIIILANSDLGSNYALNLLLPELKQHNVQLYLSSKVGGKSSTNTPEALQQLSFFEQTLFNDILFPLLESSAVSKKSSFKSFNQFESFLQQPIKTISNINSEVIISEFNHFKTDLIISIRFGLILKDNVIACSRHGVINLHSGALPELQGVMPTFRAMMKADSQITACLHYISNSEIDQGDIISTSSFPLDTAYSYIWNLLQLYRVSYKLIIEAVNRLETGCQLNSFTQEGLPAYFSFPNTEELNEFSKRGFKLFDYSELQDIVALYTSKSS